MKKLFLFNFIFILLLTVYVDFTKYHNIEIWFVKNFRTEIDLSSNFETTRKIQYKNYLNTGLKFKYDTAIISIPAFGHYYLNLNSRDDIDALSIGSHPSLKLNFYSFSYLTDFVLNKKKFNLTNNEIIQINKLYLIISKKINSLLLLDEMVYNDHSISERLYFEIIWLQFLQNRKFEDSIILKSLNDDVKIMFHFLNVAKYFAFKGNHGLIQIKTMLFVATCLRKNEDQNRLYELAFSRLDDLKDFISGGDGAIYEGSSSYWYFIYSMLNDISKLLPNKFLTYKQEFDNRIYQIQKFISISANNHGYIQGIGDGYSFFLDSNIILPLKKNRIFYFSNNFAGTNFQKGRDNFSILFFSIDNKPNGHKLPEDLSFFVSRNDTPFFMNFGSYTYDNKNEIRRVILESEKYHSVPSLLNYTNCKQSYLLEPCEFKNIINFKGVKIYDDYRIIRSITVNLNSGIIRIKDSVNANIKIANKFLINSLFKFKTFNDKLYFGKFNIKFDQCKFHSKETIYSNRPNSIDSINSINFIGNKIDLELDLNNNQSIKDSLIYYKSNFKNQRKLIYQRLVLKYDSSLPILSKTTIINIFFTLILFNFIVYWKKRRQI